MFKQEQVNADCKGLVFRSSYVTKERAKKCKYRTLQLPAESLAHIQVHINPWYFQQNPTFLKCGLKFEGSI